MSTTLKKFHCEEENGVVVYRGFMWFSRLF